MVERDDVECRLDAALEQTFPASDPIAIDVTPRRPAHLEQLTPERHAGRLPQSFQRSH